MEAKELRLGNLFKENITGQIIEVIELKKDAITFSGNFEGKWQSEPIILTEEILVKCGFEDKTYQSGYIGKEFMSNMILDFVLTKPKKLYETQDYYVFELREHRIVPIKYLHQLQNFYFSITQQELEINL